ncbi:hypothetical protein E3A20_26550 [Planctomyces bekefii]|uniref:Glycosyl hydrolase family 32 N-terminal domain-containing protein n=1 Tax=Planctomyces bekefii TaxID=1653850 RepID=A0A5C6M4U2_9PLAN|nr:hypothetical protein E3A20_26550 [Planctomyces bekefii]
MHFFVSPNLRDWKLASVTEGDAVGGRYLFECPDFLSCRWMEQQRLAGQRGRGFYAAQSFSDVPDGRRILIGWWQTETRGMPFNQSMTIPADVELEFEPGTAGAVVHLVEVHALRSAWSRGGER